MGGLFSTADAVQILTVLSQGVQHILLEILHDIKSSLAENQ